MQALAPCNLVMGHRWLSTCGQRTAPQLPGVHAACRSQWHNPWLCLAPSNGFCRTEANRDAVWLSSPGQCQRRHCSCTALVSHATGVTDNAEPEFDDSSSTSQPSLSGHDDKYSSTAVSAAPTRTSHWLDDLTETQRYVLADEWGFSLVGSSLPAGVPMRAVALAIPPYCLLPDIRQAMAGIAIPTLVIAASYAWLWFMHSITPWWQWAICWFAIGTAYTGLFQVAHECARGAYMPQFPSTQATVGALLMAPALFSLDAWRVQVFNHVNTLNQLYVDDSAWHPVTVEDVARAGVVRRLYLRLITSTPLKFLSSLGGWFKLLQSWDLFSYYDELRENIFNGWVLPALWLGLVVPAIMACTGGLQGLCNYWVAPLLFFHMWLSTLTLIQHTAPQIPWQLPGSTDIARAVVSGTVTLQLPRWLEVLLNYPNYHLPQHILFSSVPCYRARVATQALRQRLWPYMQEASLSLKLLINHITKWQIYDPMTQRYITFDEAETLIDASAASNSDDSSVPAASATADVAAPEADDD